MFSGSKVAVVIPSYNVESHISQTISTLPEFVDNIFVVDDCSSDGTADIANSISDSRICVLQNEQNLGVGGATMNGFKKAQEHGAELIVKVDGDGQMDPDRMADLLTPLKDGFDYAKGNRFLDGTALLSMPRSRKFGNLMLTFLTKLASGYWRVFDPQNGYLAIKCEMLQRIDLEKIHKRYFFENDLLINLNIASAKVVDVSMPAKYGDEESSMSISRVLFTFPALLIHRFFRRVYIKYVLRDFSVIGLFYFAGTYLMGFGVVFGIYHWIVSIASQIPATTGTVMIAVLPITLGFQLFLQAIVAEVASEQET